MKGIYKITCLSTKRFYIGSSFDIPNRFLEHVDQLIKQSKLEVFTKDNVWIAL